MDTRKGVIDCGEGATGRKSWQGKFWYDRKEATGRQARQVAACAAWVSAFWIMQGADTCDLLAYYIQVIAFSACGFFAISSQKQCSSIVGGLAGMLLAIVTAKATDDILIADMIVSAGICVYAGLMLFRVESACGWLASGVTNILATCSGWIDIPMDYAAITLWAVFATLYFIGYRSRIARINEIHRRRNHIRALRQERDKAIFDAIHGMANAFNAAQYVAGVKLPKEKQEIMDRAILRFHEEKSKIVGKRPTSIIEFMRQTAKEWKDNGTKKRDVSA